MLPRAPQTPAARLDDDGPLWDVLGGVRFALAMIVVCGHVKDFVAQGCSVYIYDLCGYTAVLGFLILSGFSIAHSLARQPTGFYRRRLLRIYPLYAAAVLASLLPRLVGPDPHPDRLPVVAAHLVFGQTFVVPPLFDNSVLWTLAIEVTFYLAAPLLTRLRTTALLWLAAASAAAFVAYPYLHIRNYYAWLLYGLPTLFLGWAWLAGFAYHRCRQSLWAGSWLTVAAVGLLTVNPAGTAPDHTVTMAAVCLLLVAGGRLPVPRPVRRALRYAGDLSYPLYLFHYPAFMILCLTMHVRWWPVLVVVVVGVAAVANASDQALKRPVRRWLDRVATAVAAQRAARPVVSLHPAAEP